MSKIRILIVDDHAMVRQGLKAFLELNEEIDVVAEAEDGRQGFTLAQQHAPDVVLMDLVMPEVDGIEATKQIQTLQPAPKVLILTSFIEDEKVFPALEAGAHGYLLKDVSPDELVLAIHATHRGEAHLHPKVTRKLMSQVTRRSQAKPSPSSASSDLTQREREVLSQIGQGHNNKRIAKELSISQKTVKTHVSNILAKLDLDDRTQAAIFAIKHGITDP